MKVQVFAQVMFAVAVAAWSTDFIKVDTSSRQFIDPVGRARLFHGVNVVYKSFPFYPSNGTFDPGLSFNQQDVNFLVENGFNIVRLYVAWQGLEISRGTYNSTYLHVLADIVDVLGRAGIYTILDCHQDIWSPKFCGEGAPGFAALYQNRSIKPLPFPEPLPFLTPYKIDPKTGYPYKSECAKRSFISYYFTDAVGKAMQSLYDNEQQIQDQFSKFWAMVADHFSDNPYVFGYELLNEPWAGDIYRHPDQLEPHIADALNLQPMYKKLHSAIRAHDDNHIILFEPSIIITSVPLRRFAASGLTEGPGGSEYNNRQALSYHIYCVLMDSDGQPLSNILCDGSNKQVMEIRNADTERLGVAGILTEWGAYNGVTVPGTKPYKDGLEIGALADDNLQSWIYWQFKGYGDFTTQTDSSEGLWYRNGTLQASKLFLLSRTYAQAVAGRYVKQSFNPVSGDFGLVFAADLAMAQSSTPTIIYLNQKLHYSSGYTVSISPADSATYHSQHNQVLVIANSKGIEDGQLVTVEIHRQSQ